MNIDRLVRLMPAALFVALLAQVVRVGLSPVTNADTYFHLRFGHEFLNGWSLRDPGSTSSLATSDWVPTQWLPEIAMAKLEDWFGLAGVAWFGSVQLVLLVAALFVACRRRSSLVVTAPITLIAFVAAADGLSVRPQVLSYAFAVLTIDAWLRTRDDGRIRWWLIPLTWLWAMCHGMWPIAIMTGLVAIVAGLLERRDGGAAMRELAVPLGSLLAATATPLGLSIYSSVIAVSDRTKFIPEWGPPDFLTPHAAVLGLMLIAAVLLGFRGPPLTWSRTLLLVFVALWAVYAARTGPLAAVLLAPLLAERLQSLVSTRESASKTEVRAVVATLVTTLAIIAAALPAVGPLQARQPAWLDAELDKVPAGSTVLNPWELGGYLLWRHPDLKIGMHGYVDLYSEQEILDLMGLLATKPGWEEALVETGASYVLVPERSALGEALRLEEGWSVLGHGAGLELFSMPAAARR